MLGSQFSQESKSNFLIDLRQHCARNFLNHRHSKLRPKLDTNIFYNLINRDSCKTRVYQSLYLVTIGVISPHICQTSNHSHLNIYNTAYIRGDCHRKCDKTTQSGQKARSRTLCDLIIDKLFGRSINIFVFCI